MLHLHTFLFSFWSPYNVGQFRGELLFKKKKMLCIQEVPSGQEFAMLDNITASSGRQTDRTERSHVRASEMEKLGETERTTWRDK